MISTFNYDLPDERIARYPLPERDSSKLLVWKSGVIHQTNYARIAEWLPANSLLVFNNSKVIAARLLFTKPTGGVIELFCLEPDHPEEGIHQSMTRTGKAKWKCLIGGASKWKRGMILEKKQRLINLQVRFIEKLQDAFVVEFSWSPATRSFAEILHEFGNVPLPPYLKREAEYIDQSRYQTIYATTEGSVAAPTAGLHFTPAIFDSFKKHRIDWLYVTLHVGAGTFMPVKSERVVDHTMHEEFIEINKSVVEAIRDKLSEPIIAVGTTSLRTLETLYWLGVKISRHSDISEESLNVNQWEAYEEENNLSALDSLTVLLEWLNRQPQQHFIIKTQLLIVPGYRLRIVHGLITNFHQPQSTLLLLIAAITGNDWKRIYQFALDNDYRFLSYGDGCLLLPG